MAVHAPIHGSPATWRGGHDGPPHSAIEAWEATGRGGAGDRNVSPRHSETEPIKIIRLNLTCPNVPRLAISVLPACIMHASTRPSHRPPSADALHRVLADIDIDIRVAAYYYSNIKLSNKGLRALIWTRF